MFRMVKMFVFLFFVYGVSYTSGFSPQINEIEMLFANTVISEYFIYLVIGLFFIIFIPYIIWVLILLPEARRQEGKYKYSRY